MIASAQPVLRRRCSTKGGKYRSFVVVQISGPSQATSSTESFAHLVSQGIQQLGRSLPLICLLDELIHALFCKSRQAFLGEKRNILIVLQPFPDQLETDAFDRDVRLTADL